MKKLIYFTLFCSFFALSGCATKQDIPKSNNFGPFTPYDKAVESAPFNASRYYLRGLAYYNSGVFVEAKNDFSKAIEMDPSGECGTKSTGIAYYMRGMVYFDKGLYDEAIKDFNIAIKLEHGDRDKSLAYNNRGLAYFRKDLFDDAINDFDKAISLDPTGLYRTENKGATYINRGDAYFHKDLYDEAINDYSKSIEFNPNDIRIYIRRAKALLLKGLYDDTIKDCNKAMELNPTFEEKHDIYSYRARAYLHNGLYDEAINDCNKTIEQCEKYPSINLTFDYNTRALSYFSEGKYENARKDFNTLLEDNPKNWGSLLDLSLVSLMINKDNDANTYFANAEKLEPLLSKGMEGIEDLEKQKHYFTSEEKNTLKQLFKMLNYPKIK